MSFVQRFLQRIHHLQHALLAVRTESHIHISLAQRLAQFAISEVHAALPARLNFLSAR